MNNALIAGVQRLPGEVQRGAQDLFWQFGYLCGDILHELHRAFGKGIDLPKADLLENVEEARKGGFAAGIGVEMEKGGGQKEVGCGAIEFGIARRKEEASGKSPGPEHIPG